MTLLGKHEMLSKAYLEQFVLPNSVDEKNYSSITGWQEGEVL